VLEGNKYLFLGYKGSGKSALGQRLKLLGAANPELFVETILLGDFPFSHFTRIIESTGPSDQEAHFPAVWTWILLLYLLHSFQRDEGARIGNDLQRAIRSLNDHGLLPAGELKLMVLKSAKSGIKGMIPRFGEASREQTFEKGDTEALSNVEILRHLAMGFASNSRHILVIDGFDDILTQKKIQYNVLVLLS
jgi:hypothetical protein